MAGVCVMDWTTWWCVLCANLPPQSRLICVCLFFHWTFSLLAQCHNAFADSCFALHVRELFSPPGSDSVSSWSAGSLTRSVKSDCNFPRPAFRFCHDQSQPRRSRPRRLTTALRIVSAMIGASSCRSSPRNLISRCPLVSGNWASGFISPVSALVEAGRGSNARSVLCWASELHQQQAMTSVDRQERGQRTPDTSHL